ncbi:MAG: DUF4340 domain-containing protein, partial [Bacteriovoracia bacterium]
MKLKTLTTITSVLFVLSLVVFFIKNQKGLDLTHGSEYITGLDIARISKIELSAENDKTLIFQKDNNRFILANKKNFPADNKEINELIFKIANIRIAKKVTDNPSEERLKELRLSDSNFRYQIQLFNNDGNEMISFKVGKNVSGEGSYLYKNGQDEVYLSQNTLWFSSSPKGYFNTKLIDIKDEDIKKLKVNATDKDKDYFKHFTNISFDNFYDFDDQSVTHINFDTDIELCLKNYLVYKLALGKNDKEHFLKISALVDEVADKIIV